MPTYHDETQSDKHLERSSPLLPPVPDAEAQRKRMLIALGILLLALAAVIIKDWDFWFPSGGADSPEVVAARKAKMLAPETPAEPVAATHEHRTAKPAEAEQTLPDTPFKTERTVLPPLDVEVVAGNQRVSVPGKNPAIHVDVGTGITGSGGSAGSGAAGSQSGMVSATDRVELSPQIQQRLTVAVPPDYPLLARQMKVQGAVSLQALIARDGTIQELQILSGPEILATAAREAVKQWHFKPYLQSGQPVETQARITVNFTISTN
ncbi:MAG: energy transducer TonB [Terriglobales bacterium]